MSLSAVIERIATIASTLNDTTSHHLEPKSHYATAILLAPLTDYVRDAELVESRLLTVPRPSIGESAPLNVDLKRKEAVNATPLRKARESPLVILDPEEYIKSVIRLTEKYHTMPRAESYARELLQKTQHIQKRLPELERIHKEILSGSDTPGSAVKAKTRTLREEERLTREMEARAATFRDQRDALLNRLNTASSSHAESDSSVFMSPSALKGSMVGANLLESQVAVASPIAAPRPLTARDLAERRAARQAARKAARMSSAIVAPPIDPSSQESAFWGSTPSFSLPKNPLMSDLANTTTESTDNDAPSSSHNPESDADAAGDDEDEGDVTIQAQSGAVPPAQSSAKPARRTFSLLGRSLNKSANSRLSVAEPTDALARPITPPPVLPGPAADLAVPSLPPQAAEPTVSKYSFPITADVNGHLIQAWRTVGDTILPEHKYNSNPAPTSEISLDILTAIISLPSKTDDPAGSFTTQLSSLVAPHRVSRNPTLPIMPLNPVPLQVLTALLVLTLVGAPNAVITLTKLKETLKGNPWASDDTGTDWPTKAVYHAIGKKLVTVDRREGLVRFAKF